MTRDAQARERRRQQGTLLDAVMACLLLLVGIQWVLLSVAIEGWLEGHAAAALPAAVGSAACLGAAVWLVRRAPAGRLRQPEQERSKP